MYAVVVTGGQQFKVSAGDTITVKRLDAEVGSTIELGTVLMVGGEGANLQIGTPNLEGVKVTAEVVAHGKGEKREMFKWLRTRRNRVMRGFRPSETTLSIQSIVAA
jgi:large subunit ribosomal protein L21